MLLGLTGIGLVNATTRAHDLLAHGQIAGLVMSGTAGTSHHIGDVVLASDLMEGDRKGVFHPNAALVALARRAATALPEPLERCTPVPPQSPDAPVVCLLFDPTVIFGGRDVSADPFGGRAFPCKPGGDEVVGCELPAPAVSRGTAKTARSQPSGLRFSQAHASAKGARLGDRCTHASAGGAARARLV